jgi:prophage tail gpP-like protein
MAVEILDAPTGHHVPAGTANVRTQQIPDPEEVATVIINGKRFVGWESVYVQARWKDPNPVFQFVVAENDPTTEFARLQFKPNDFVTVYLGGQLAVSGYILRRQTAYDASRHAVQFYGVGLTWFAARASIIDKTNKFDGMTLEQVAAKVLAPFEAGLKVVGKLDEKPFEQLAADPGITVFEFLDKIARERNAIFGSDHRGNFLLIGDHVNPIVWNLVEGKNIKHCECTISIENIRDDIRVWGQRPANDEVNGADAAHQEATAHGMDIPHSPLLIPMEQPVFTIAEVAKRAATEAKWTNGTYVTAVITVQGWLRGGIALWTPGDNVIVTSPMAMLFGEKMTINCATFTQDSEGGTNTQLELVMPWLLLDEPNLSPGDRWTNEAYPGEAKASTTHTVETAPDAKPSVAAPQTLPPVE